MALVVAQLLVRLQLKKKKTATARLAINLLLRLDCVALAGERAIRAHGEVEPFGSACTLN